jgi:DNA-binding NtrC family response regulator
VRELENAVARAIALSGGATYLKKEHLLPMSAHYKTATEVAVDLAPLRDVLRKAERDYIARVLRHTGGHRMHTAEILGISRKVLWEKLRDHDIEDPKKPEG